MDKRFKKNEKKMNNSESDIPYWYIQPDYKKSHPFLWQTLVGRSNTGLYFTYACYDVSTKSTCHYALVFEM